MLQGLFDGQELLSAIKLTVTLTKMAQAMADEAAGKSSGVGVHIGDSSTLLSISPVL
jgi:hypothetical protein